MDAIIEDIIVTGTKGVLDSDDNVKSCGSFLDVFGFVADYPVSSAVIAVMPH